MQQQRPLQDLSSLDVLPTGRFATVLAVQAPAGQADWALQLEDLGFVAGERVVVLKRGAPGGDPLVVRVGLSTYALRRAEARCVRVDSGSACQDEAWHG